MSNPSSFRLLRNYDAFRKANQDRLHKINDIVVEAHLAIQGLQMLSRQLDVDRNTGAKSTTFQIDVPSTKKSKTTTIRRKPDAIKVIIANRIETKEVLQSIVFAISMTEDYINDVLTLIMEAYPLKLLISAKGNQQTGNSAKSINLSDLIEVASAEAIFCDQAKIRARDALYGTPEQYAKYMTAVLGFELPQDILDKYVETKATRDLYIHGDGKINSIYLSKVGNLSRGLEGELASLNQKYFKESIGTMKQIFTTIYKGMLSKYGDSAEVEKILARRD